MPVCKTYNAFRGNFELCKRSSPLTFHQLFSVIGCMCLLAQPPAWAQSRNEPQHVLHLADQRVDSAQLLDIADDGRLIFQTTSGVQTYDLHDIVRWGKERSTPSSHYVWLSDGSWLAGRVQWKSERSFEVTSDWFQPQQFHLEDVRGLILQPPVSAKSFAELEQRMRAATGAADVLWNQRGEPLSGLLSLTLRQPVDGNSEAVPSWSLKTKASAQSVALDADNIQAVVWSPVLRQQLSSLRGNSLMVLRDGSRLHVSALMRSGEGRVAVVLGNQQRLDAFDASRQFVAAIARISGNPRKVTWISDMEPARYRFMQEGGLEWPLGRDKDLFGRPLIVADEVVQHGLVVHAPAQVAYRWDGRAAKFLADLDLIGAGEGASSDIGSVECKVLVAREGKLVEVFKSPVLRRETPPAPVQVDVDGAQLIVLLVEDADQGMVGDHVLWRDARLALGE